MTRANEASEGNRRGVAFAPTVYINPLLALQAFLLDSGSRLVVEHMRDDKGVYIFKFGAQIPPSHVAQIAQQGWVRVGSEEGWTGGDLVRRRTSSR